jgi:phosphoribosylformylglycinamidine synthase
LISSCHDVSDGGLITALVESAMPRELGFEINTDAHIRKDAFLFGEAQGRVVVSVSKSNIEKFIHFFEKMEVDYLFLGEVKGKNVVVDGEIFFDITTIKNKYENVIEDLLQ